MIIEIFYVMVLLLLITLITLGLRLHNRKIRANDFLLKTIGAENHSFFLRHGYIEIYTKKSIYRITKHGYISKIPKKETLIQRLPYFFDDDISWNGRVNSNLPMEDNIAIIYMRIKSDSNKFDKDKQCGSISIENWRPKGRD